MIVATYCEPGHLHKAESPEWKIFGLQVQVAKTAFSRQHDFAPTHIMTDLHLTNHLRGLLGQRADVQSSADAQVNFDMAAYFNFKRR